MIELSFGTIAIIVCTNLYYCFTTALVLHYYCTIIALLLRDPWEFNAYDNVSIIGFSFAECCFGDFETNEARCFVQHR